MHHPISPARFKLLLFAGGLKGNAESKSFDRQRCRCAGGRMTPQLRQWRKAERERLIGERLAVTAERRSAMTEKIVAGLDAVIGDVAGRVVSVYWPF
ncbi:MAG: hypothetical protein IT533_13675, partial [Hyphomicrobiales bacterium]|nr:hypothetical protein [Hyphomicrobiales bacterium]